MCTSLFALKSTYYRHLLEINPEKMTMENNCLSPGQSIELAVFANTSKSPLARKPNQEGMHPTLCSAVRVDGERRSMAAARRS